MTKKQHYSIKFKTDQTSALNALSTMSTGFNSTWKLKMREALTAGTAIESLCQLDSSGTVLTVTRTMTDSVYGELVPTIYSLDSLNAIANANSAIDSINDARFAFTTV